MLNSVHRCKMDKDSNFGTTGRSEEAVVNSRFVVVKCEPEPEQKIADVGRGSGF
jgi:hypothetical protein